MTPFRQDSKPTYRHCGGDILFGSEWVSNEDAQAKLDLALRDNDACLRVGDRIGSRVARTIFLDLTDALAEQAKWLRCANTSPRLVTGRDLDVAVRTMPDEAIEHMMGAA